jgi:glycosyltransferase involved in cell wall biosynthesis
MWREMKIAFVIANLNHGGAERAVSNISLALQAEHDISIILFDASEVGYPYGGRIIDLESHPKESKLGKLINVFSRALKLRKLYKKQKFDAIFAFMEGAGIPSLMASKETIASVRDNPQNLPKLYQPIFPRLYKKAKKVVACSHAIENDLIQNYGFSNTTTIHNIVDIDRAIEQSEKTVAIGNKRPFILSAGRLVSQKGYDLLIEAYENSTVKNDLDLLICGEGEDREKLQSMIDDKGLSDNIILKGNVENPFAYYAKAEFYVLSSRHEGFPNILIEALSCGCPCIAFDCKTGPNEIIKQGENGLLVEAENVSAMTKAIDKLAEDKALQNLFKQNARKSVEHLSPESIAKEWLKLVS